MRNEGFNREEMRHKKAWKNQKQKEKVKKPLLFSGQVIDGNRILDGNAPLKTGDVINWNEYEYMWKLLA